MNFITKIGIKDNIYKNEYPYNIPILKNFNDLIIDAPVTFFVGENGSGKSTLLEGIAVACGLNPEGGSENFNFSTNETHSVLYKDLIVSKTWRKINTKYFLRTESFYNVATEVESFLDDGKPFTSHGSKSLHFSSHGEAFMQLIENRFWSNGLYFLDEPESALSPLKQMRLLVFINKLVKNGSQFIIATHSPILLSYPGAIIYDFDDNLNKVNYMDTEHFKLYKLFLNNPELMLKKLFENND